MSATPPQINRLLVRGTNWLGDAVMTTPALIRLRETFPRAEISVVTPEKLADLYKHHPAIHETMPIPAGESFWATVRRIRSGRFDAALVLPNSHRTALEVFLAGIPVRAGVAQPLRSFLLTHVVQQRAGKVSMRKLRDAEIRARLAREPDPIALTTTGAHQVHDYLHLVSALFGCNSAPVPPLLRVAEGEQQQARKRFGLDPNRRLLALSPGAQYGPAKRWPAENFIHAALAVRKEMDIDCLVIGGKNDAPVCVEIAETLNREHPRLAQNLAGATSLRELMAVLRSSNALLTNDSGPMHLAVALGTPVVAIFGSTSPDLTGPFPQENPLHSVVRVHAPCSPCFRRECPIDLRCLKGISPDAVTPAILRGLSQPRS